MSVLDDLREWRSLLAQRDKLRAGIESREEQQRHLRDTMLRHIRSPQLDGMPRPPGYSDQLAAMVARVVTQLEDLTREILALAVEMAQVQRRLDDLETTVASLSAEQAEVLRLIYRDGHTQRSAALRLHRSRSSVQRLEEAALESLGQKRAKTGPLSGHFSGFSGV